MRAAFDLFAVGGAFVPGLRNNGLLVTMLENMFFLLLDDGFPRGKFHSFGRTCGETRVLVSYATR